MVEDEEEEEAMFSRGEGTMISLQDASRRLQVPVDTLWRWVNDGKLSAEAKPGRGVGMEYYLGQKELKRALQLRDEELPPPEDLAGEEPVTPDNVIPIDFPDGALRAGPAVLAGGGHGQALRVLENLRAEALSAVERQLSREVAITELAAAVENFMKATLEAMDRAQDRNEGRLVAELESLRVRLASQIQDRERADLRLRDELVATKRQLASALETLSPKLKPLPPSTATFAPMDSHNAQSGASSG